MAKDNILIIGATGWIGTYITSSILSSRSSFGRIAIFTSPSSFSQKSELFDSLKAQGAEIIVGDIKKEEDLVNAFEGINVVVSAVGRNVIADQISWIPHLVSSPSITHFFPSEYGTDIEYGPSSATEKPHQQKLKVRAALREIEGKELDVTYLVTGPFAGGYLGCMPKAIEEIGSFDVKGKRAVVIGDGKGRISLCTEGDVGKLLVASLLSPSTSKNIALKVNSFTTTPLDIVSEFEKQTGGEKWEVSYTPLEHLKEAEKKAWENSSPAATGYTLRRIWAEGGTLYQKRDNGVIGADDGMDTLEDAVKLAVTKQIGSTANL